MKRLDFIIGFITLVIVCLFVIFEAYLWINYGNKPISETPTWVLWFMLKK